MILLIDNYDSFTYNIYDYLSQLGEEVVVCRNDELHCDVIEQMHPQAIVISPGPKKPSDAGITMQVIDRFHTTIPILGICLGYQAIGEYFGATLVRSAVPVHGKTSEMVHSGDPVFAGVPSPTEVMRYHSLNIVNVAPPLKIIATTAGGENMALKHATLPIYGLQFHPESILTSYGMLMLRNWYSMLMP